jgi:alpha-1,2-mannosyltransferase
LLASTHRGSRWAFATGVCLGAACCVKIWWAVPFLIVVGVTGRRSGWRVSGLVAAGGFLAGALVAGPFFAVAPGPMWRMVVTDQLGRHLTTSPLRRLTELTGLHAAAPRVGNAAAGVALVVIGALFLAVVRAAWRMEAARLIVVVLLAQLVVLGLSPTYFTYYGGYPAAALALTVAAAHQTRSAAGHTAGRFRPAPIALCVITCLTAVAIFGPGVAVTSRFPRERLAAATVGRRCVMSDSPAALIELNVLSRDLAAGCPNWVDVSGRTYDVDASSGGEVSRRRNARWQRDVSRYLLSGDAVILIRTATGLAPATRRRLMSGRPLASDDGYIVYAVRPRPAG